MQVMILVFTGLTDGGTSWIKLSNGMPFVPVLDFSFYSNGSTVILEQPHTAEEYMN